MRLSFARVHKLDTVPLVLEGAREVEHFPSTMLTLVRRVGPALQDGKSPRPEWKGDTVRFGVRADVHYLQSFGDFVRHVEVAVGRDNHPERAGWRCDRGGPGIGRDINDCNAVTPIDAHVDSGSIWRAEE